MTLFLNGGGCGEQLKESYQLFKEKVDTNKPLLYVPLAMKKEKYSSCLEWILGELADFHFPKIDMITSATELCTKNLAEYAALFIGGGNTYKLLSELKSCNAFSKINAFLEEGGIVFGGSAGAILFGKTIDSCRHADPNELGLKETSGFNKVFEAYIGAHYPNDDPAKTQRATECFTELSNDAPVIVLPEEDTLVIDKNTVKVVGPKLYHIFKKGSTQQMEPNQTYFVSTFRGLIKE